MAGDKWRPQGSDPRTVCVRPPLPPTSPHTHPRLTHCSLVSLPSFLFLKHTKFFPAQGHETYCSVCLEHPSPLLAEMTSCLS